MKSFKEFIVDSLDEELIKTQSGKTVNVRRGSRIKLTMKMGNGNKTVNARVIDLPSLKPGHIKVEIDGERGSLTLPPDAIVDIQENLRFSTRDEQGAKAVKSGLSKKTGVEIVTTIWDEMKYTPTIVFTDRGVLLDVRKFAPKQKREVLDTVISILKKERKFFGTEEVQTGIILLTKKGMSEATASSSETRQVLKVIYDTLKKQPSYRPNDRLASLGSVKKVKPNVFSVGDLNGHTDYTVDLNKQKIVSATHSQGRLNRFEYDIKTGKKKPI